jgi:hypothetical protein
MGEKILSKLSYRKNIDSNGLLNVKGVRYRMRGVFLNSRINVKKI